MFKKITLNLALVFCLLLLITITACDDVIHELTGHREAIERVLDEDKNCKSSSVAAIYDKMRAISLKGCPHKFTAAYLKYLDAWHRAARLERKYNSLQGGLEIIWDTLTLSKSPFYDEEAKEITDDINTTYRECLSIAAEYGVNISKYK